MVSDNDDQEDILDIVEPIAKSEATYKDVEIFPSLSHEQKMKVEKLLKDFSQIFSDVPGKSKTVMHHIKLVNDCPFKIKPYVIPEHYKEKVESEITELEKLKFIQRSNSNYSSPMVVIRKKDGTIRICIDYRNLNKITVTDAEPIPGADELIASMSLSCMFSKLDMTKGYYQYL